MKKNILISFLFLILLGGVGYSLIKEKSFAAFTYPGTTSTTTQTVATPIPTPTPTMPPTPTPSATPTVTPSPSPSSSPSPTPTPPCEDLPDTLEGCTEGLCDGSRTKCVLTEDTPGGGVQCRCPKYCHEFPAKDCNQGICQDTNAMNCVVYINMLGQEYCSCPKDCDQLNSWNCRKGFCKDSTGEKVLRDCFPVHNADGTPGCGCPRCDKEKPDNTGNCGKALCGGVQRDCLVYRSLELGYYCDCPVSCDGLDLGNCLEGLCKDETDTEILTKCVSNYFEMKCQCKKKCSEVTIPDGIPLQSKDCARYGKCPQDKICILDKASNNKCACSDLKCEDVIPRAHDIDKCSEVTCSVNECVEASTASTTRREFPACLCKQPCENLFFSDVEAGPEVNTIVSDICQNVGLCSEKKTCVVNYNAATKVASCTCNDAPKCEDIEWVGPINNCKEGLCNGEKKGCVYSGQVTSEKMCACQTSCESIGKPDVKNSAAYCLNVGTCEEPQICRYNLTTQICECQEGTTKDPEMELFTPAEDTSSTDKLSPPSYDF